MHRNGDENRRKIRAIRTGPVGHVSEAYEKGRGGGFREKVWAEEGRLLTRARSVGTAGLASRKRHHRVKKRGFPEQCSS